MLLRSSSTPILGSMVPTFSHSDNFKEKEGKTNSLSEFTNRFGFHCTTTHSSHEACSVDEVKEVISVSTVRRVQSESDLGSLSRGSPAHSNLAAETFMRDESFDDFNVTSMNKPWSRRISAQKKLSTLLSAPSFSCYFEELEEESSENDTEGSMIEARMQDFSFGNKVTKGEQDIMSAQPMFMARGLGIDVMEPSTDMGDGRGTSNPKGTSTCGGGGDGFEAGSDNIEQYYQKMLKQNPTNPLFLRNYAQFLYEAKEYDKAEGFYSRAILAQPDDGEVLVQYAKFIWELYGDEERAASYFEQAVQASPTDCHVLAAYASFLWNTDGEEKEENTGFYWGQNEHGIVASAATPAA